jgi:hypothetical protein
MPKTTGGFLRARRIHEFFREDPRVPHDILQISGIDK